MAGAIGRPLAIVAGSYERFLFTFYWPDVDDVRQARAAHAAPRSSRLLSAPVPCSFCSRTCRTPALECTLATWGL